MSVGTNGGFFSGGRGIAHSATFAGGSAIGLSATGAPDVRCASLLTDIIILLHISPASTTEEARHIAA
jgi:hypothetical protein